MWLQEQQWDIFWVKFFGNWLMDQEDNRSSREGRPKLHSEIRDYIEKRVELVSITIAEQVSLIVAKGIQRFLGLAILGAAVFFLWFGVGFLLSELIGSNSAGFAIGSIPLFLFAFIFLKKRSGIITDRIQAEIIRNVLDNLDSEKKKQDRKQIEDGKGKE